MVEEKPKPKGANELREKLKRQEIMQNTRKRRMRDGRDTRGPRICCALGSYESHAAKSAKVTIKRVCHLPRHACRTCRTPKIVVYCKIFVLPSHKTNGPHFWSVPVDQMPHRAMYTFYHIRAIRFYGPSHVQAVGIDNRNWHANVVFLLVWFACVSASISLKLH